MKNDTNNKIEQAIEIERYIDSRVTFFRGKMDRSRKYENYQRHQKMFWHYRKFQKRALDLIMTLKRHPLWSFQGFSTESYLKGEAERIAKGKHIFETRHKYSLYFLRAGLDLDYGTYLCDRCNRTFYHSPSRILRAAKVVHKCACGYCTNEIIGSDWNEEPYY